MRFRKAILLICLSLISAVGCKEDEPTKPQFVKEIYTYKSVVIGSQEWMAEDLKNNTFCNDEPIPEVKDAAQWAALTTPAWSYIENDKAKHGTLGKLYNWYAVSDERKLCPCGWHVPSYDDLIELRNYLGGEDVAGGALKATGTIEAGDGLWYEPNTGATNSSGFSGVPNGTYYSDGTLAFAAYGTVWWSSNGNYLDPEPTTYQVIHTSEKFSLGTADKKNGFAVRCIKG